MYTVKWEHGTCSGTKSFKTLKESKEYAIEVAGETAVVTITDKRGHKIRKL